MLIKKVEVRAEIMKKGMRQPLTPKMLFSISLTETAP